MTISPRGGETSCGAILRNTESWYAGYHHYLHYHPHLATLEWQPMLLRHIVVMTSSLTGLNNEINQELVLGGLFMPIFALRTGLLLQPVMCLFAIRWQCWDHVTTDTCSYIEIANLFHPTSFGCKYLSFQCCVFFHQLGRLLASLVISLFCLL